MMPIALKAVQLQLKAMGAQRYELGVRVPPELADDGESHMTLRNGQNDDGLTTRWRSKRSSWSTKSRT